MTRPKLPPDTITVSGGRVIHIEEWTLWNLVPANTLSVSRRDEGFHCSFGEPEHGGGSRTGPDIDTACSHLHEKFRGPLTQLFAMQDPTEADIKALFKRNKLQVVFV